MMQPLMCDEMSLTAVNQQEPFNDTPQRKLLYSLLLALLVCFLDELDQDWLVDGGFE